MMEMAQNPLQRMASTKSSTINMRMQREKRQMADQIGELNRLKELANDSRSATKQQPGADSPAAKRDPGVVNVSELLNQGHQKS